MKLSKTQICLHLYEELLKNDLIDIGEMKVKFRLEDKTFTRYINEIRAYLLNFYTAKEIVYLRSKHTYRLVTYENK